jgi:hypothetical protein
MSYEEQKPYHLAEYHTDNKGKRVNLSKASLGDFCYHALLCGAEIYQLWAFNHNYKRSAVYPAIKATQKQVDYLAEQGYNFVEPVTFKLN